MAGVVAARWHHVTAPVDLTIVNMNADPAELDGCHALQAAFSALGAHAQIVHHAGLRDGTVQPDPASHGVVLGPQGTPFDAYDDGFLPWLRQWTTQRTEPLLAVCGGMQALALAHGGTLQTVDGSPQARGGSYGARPKITGLVAVTLEPGPRWWQRVAGDLPATAMLWQRHAEQVATLPAPWVVLGRSAQTPVEAFAHPTLPRLACQFHPERGWGEGGEAGQQWLRAWLRLLDQRKPRL
jgi:GMP synthase-like glutamine amidotransferase